MKYQGTDILADANFHWRFPEELIPPCRHRRPWEALAPAIKEKILTQADAYLAFDWPALPASAFMAFARTGDRLSWENPFFLRRQALKTLLLGECAQNSGRYLDDIINGIWAICEESYWGVSAHHYRDIRPLPDVQEPYIDLFAAETGELMVLTLYMLRDKLEDVAREIPERIQIELQRRIITPFLSHNDFWWMGYKQKVNNWNPWILSNLIPVFLLAAEGETQRNGMEKIMQLLEHYDRDTPADGGCDEGISYWGAAGAALFDCLYWFDKASGGRITAWEDPKVQNIILYPVRIHIADDVFVNFADGGRRPGLPGGTLIRFGRQVGNPEAVALGRYLLRQSSTDSWENLYHLHRGLFDLFKPSETDVVCQPLKKSEDTYFPILQQAFFRETSDEHHGFFLAAKGGNNNESHNHNDVGSCILYLHGQPVLIDAGVGVYTKKTFSSQRYEIWTMQSGWHNLPQVNGQDQLPGESYQAAQSTFIRQGESSRFSLDITAAYPADCGLEQLTRQYELDRSAGIVSLTDTFHFQGEGGEVKEYMLLMSRPDIRDGSISIPVSPNAAVRLVIPPAWTASVEERQIDDPRLRASCGAVVYRLCLQKRECGKQEEYSVCFQYK